MFKSYLDPFLDGTKYFQLQQGQWDGDITSFLLIPVVNQHFFSLYITWLAAGSARYQGEVAFLPPPIFIVDNHFYYRQLFCRRQNLPISTLSSLRYLPRRVQPFFSSAKITIGHLTDYLYNSDHFTLSTSITASARTRCMPAFPLGHLL